MPEKLPDRSDFDDLTKPLIPSERKAKKVEDLTSEERAEMIENSLLFEEVTKERQAEQLKTHGKTDKELEAEADAWLKNAGFDDLVEGKK